MRSRYAASMLDAAGSGSAVGSDPVQNRTGSLMYLMEQQYLIEIFKLGVFWIIVQNHLILVQIQH